MVKSSASDSSLLSTRGVLIVEDEPLQRALLREHVIRSGLRPVEAADGRAALEALNADNRIVLVLTDVRLPDPNDGIQFIRAVRRGWPNIPVAAVTGHPDDLLSLQETPESPVVVVPKPVRPRQIEEALRLALPHLLQLHDLVTCGIVVQDAAGHITYLNRAAKEMLQIQEQTSGDREPADPRFLDESGHALAIADLPSSLVLRSGEPRKNFVAGLRLSSGSLRWFQGDSIPVVDAKERVEQVVTTFVDVTAQREAEDSLRESEDRNRDLVENSQDLICTHDLQGRILSVNIVPARVLGYEPEELLKLSVRDVLDPEVRQTFDDYLTKIRQTGEASGLMKVMTRTGERRIWEYSSSLRTDRVPSPVVRAMGHDVTARKQAEDALRRSEARFRALTEHASDIVLALDRDGSVRYASPSVQHVLGAGITDDEPRSIFDCIHPEDADRMAAALTQVLHASGTTETAEFRIGRGSGPWRTLECMLTNLTDNGAVGGIVLNGHDVTQRKQIEDALHATEEQYRIIVETADEGIMVVDADGRIVLSNPKLRAVLGYTAEELVGRPFFEFQHEQDRSSSVRRFREHRDPREPVHETRFCRKDGVEIWVSLALSHIFDAHREFTGAIAMLSDITQQRQARQALQASEQRYRTIVDLSTEGICLLDADERILYANPRISAMLGYHPDELVGRDLNELVDSTALPPSALEGEREASRSQFDLRMRRKDGSFIWTTLSSSTLAGGDGEFAGSISMFTDVTTRRDAAEQLQLLQAAVENSHDAVMITTGTAPLSIIYVNEAFCQATGYSREEIIGASPAILNGPRTEMQLVDQVRRQLAQGKTTNADILVCGKEGKQLDVEWHAVPTRDGAGRVTHVMHILRDLSARKRAQEALAHQALHDPLTDLPNRTLLQDRLEQALLTARRNEKPLALMIMDLDRFKEINDTFGHDQGDLVLRQVGPRLQRALRESDTVARLGGDEFAIILPGCGSRQAAGLVVAKIQRLLEQPFVIEGQSLDVTTSIGVALFPEHGEDVQTLMRRADVAMYAAKHDQEGYSIYTPESDQNSASHLALTSELRQAIEHAGLVLHYQPKIDFATRQLDGVEALVRWQHPQQGLLSPDRFVGLAEQNGLIKGLTNWVLNAALRQIRLWRESGLDLTVAVNLSMRNLQDPELPTIIASLLHYWELEPSVLRAEITETVIMSNPVRTMNVITALSELGVQLAIDDFGTGYSSLGYLKRLPVSEIKIDKSFVSEMMADENDAVIVRSTIDLAHNLELKVVAEGVENRRTWQLLESLGCDIAQGFYMGRPMPPREFGRWLTSSQWSPLASSAKRKKTAAIAAGSNRSASRRSAAA